MKNPLQMRRKILNYFEIDGTPGGNQEWLPEWDMNMGGCAAVTACDVSIFLARLNPGKFRALYPFDSENLSRGDFIKFALLMKPFLTPRYHGIDYLETYICGFYDYMKEAGNENLILEGLSGDADYGTLEAAVKSQIDRNFPVPFLMLNHHDPKLEDFEWHWFNLAGYEETEDGISVMTVTYAEYQWFSLREMHDTRNARKGGIIKIRERESGRLS